MKHRKAPKPGFWSVPWTPGLTQINPDYLILLILTEALLRLNRPRGKRKQIKH